MPSESPIYIVHEVDQGRSAKRLFAALCLMEFYCAFVRIGTTIWGEARPTWGVHLDDALVAEWCRVPLFVASGSLYLCGRGLWRGGRWEQLWLWVGIIGLLFMIVCACVSAIAENLAAPSSRMALGLGPPTDDPTVLDVLNGLQAGYVHVPLWVALIVLWRVMRPGSRLRRTDRAPWAHCAAAYCFAWIPTASFATGLFYLTFGDAQEYLPGVPASAYASCAAFGMLLLGTGIALLRGMRIARSGALMTTAIHAVAVGFNWFVLSWLVRIAVTALLNSVPFATPVERPYFCTKHDFMWLFVLPAHYVLPWLLIAIYAWRVPMRRPADDDTPFPRRYCAKCHYNLYGCTSERCPECGNWLSPTRSSRP